MAGIIAHVDDDISKLRALKKEIEGVMKLLKHDELCAAMGEVDDAFCQALLVVGDICRIMKL